MARPKSPPFYVYTLTDPRNGRIFYVGKGTVIDGRYQGRFSTLCHEAKHGRVGVKYDTIREIQAEGLKPAFTKVFETEDEEAALSKEKELVERLGASLDNRAPGGDGKGDDHWTRRHPERVLRGADHPIHTHPEVRAAATTRFQNMPTERRARGERHGMSKLTDAQVVEMKRRCQEEKATQTELAEVYGVSLTQIGRVLRSSRTGPAALGDRHGNTKLAPEQRAEIQRRLVAGERGAALAEAFSVSPSLVSLIRREIEVEIIPSP